MDYGCTAVNTEFGLRVSLSSLVSRFFHASIWYLCPSVVEPRFPG